MRLREVVIALACGLMLLGGPLAGAAPASRGEIGHRIHETQERIDRANAAGLLSRYQRYRLQHKLDKIRYKYDKMKHEGLSPRDREKFDEVLDELNEVIPRTRGY